MYPNDLEDEPQQQQQQVAPSAPSAPAAPTIAMTPEMVQQIAMQSAMQFHQQQAQRPPAQVDPSQMSPEQRREYFQEFDVDDDFATSFAQTLQPDENGAFNPKAVATALKALNAQQRKEYSRALALEAQKIHEQYAPIVQQATRARETEVWNTFTTEYENLKPFKPLVDSIASSLNPQQFTSRETFLAAVAQQAETVLRQANPQFSAKAARQQQQQTAPQQNQFMPAMAAQAGVQQQFQQQKPANPYYDADVFGPA